MPSEQTQPRAIKEEGQEARIAAIVEPEIEALGFRLVRVKLLGQNGLTLQIMAERDDGTMSVEDCEAVSKTLSPVLDIEEPISGAYNLEISSPGIDRPMVRLSDFVSWCGHVAKMETRYLVNNRKRYKGIILGVDGETINFRYEEDGTINEFSLNIHDIANARLVMSDDLIREALQRDKALRKANQIDPEESGLNEENQLD